VLIDRARPGVVCRERKLLVVVVPIEKLFEVGDTAANVLFGI
jgi:hypothetical protein